MDKEVLELDRSRRLQEIHARLDPRAQAEVRGGGVFRGGELLRRRLLHEGTLLCKVQGTRMKGSGLYHLLWCNMRVGGACKSRLCLSPDVQVLLMSDILVFLQEKDQKFTFVVSLVSLRTFESPLTSSAVQVFLFAHLSAHLRFRTSLQWSH